MGKALGVVVGVLVALTGCTSVKVVQRDDCWVKRTEKWNGSVNEELGPCARPAPAWVADRHTRLVQECVAQADYRWQTKALEAFSRGLPWPEQTGQEEVLQLCMNEAARAYIVENDALKSRLAEVKAEQETLKEALASNDAFLKDSHELLATSLGEAANKPPGTATATATATSDTRASTEATDTETRSSTPVAPAITWVSTQGGPACGAQPAPQLDQAEAAKQTAAADTVKRKPKPKVVKTDASTAKAPLCAPAEPAKRDAVEGDGAKDKVAEVVSPPVKAPPAAPAVP